LPPFAGAADLALNLDRLAVMSGRARVRSCKGNISSSDRWNHVPRVLPESTHAASSPTAVATIALPARAMIGNAPVVLPSAQWAAIESAHATPPRAYHDFDHVCAVLRHYDEVDAGPGWTQPVEIYLAILYHDAIYEAGRHDNETRSAELAVAEIARWLPDAGIDTARVAELIALTARHGRLAPADLGNDAAADDARHFLDCDMAILGAEPAVFDAYDRGIAAEYRGRIPGWLFRINRRRFLKGLLAKERIFLSDFFHVRLDAQARDNLRRALGRKRREMWARDGAGRIALRPLTDEDEALYCALYTDPMVMRQVGEPLSWQSARDAFSRVLRQMRADPPRSRYWAVTRRGKDGGDGDPLGLVALIYDRDRAASAEIGILLRPDARGLGVGGEAVAALVDHVFSTTDIARLWTRHAATHAGAAGIMRQLGFDPMPADPEAPDRASWVLVREAWRGRKLADGFAFQPPAG
jgi:predicted metal-dependent HD superfamily phosphohydrolase/RimJ/RimL family protein N-acetyltransferase